MLVLLLGICATIRIIYFVQTHQTTFADMHRWPESDMHYYYSWSDKIAGGDWWSRDLVVPQAQWHVEVVSNHIQATPGALDQLKLGQRPEGVTPAAYVWNRWMRVPIFYQDALYPYLLAVTARVVGPDVRWVFGWQLLLGVATSLLIWDLTRRVFGDAVGVVAGALAALCAPLMYYELLLLRDSTIVAVSVLIAWATFQASARTHPRVWVMTGVIIGLAALLKSSLLLFAVGIPIGLWVTSPAARAERLRCIGAFVLGVVAGCLPLAVRNLIVGVPPLALASSGPLTFVAANEPTTQPEHGNYVNTTVLASFLGRTDGGWRAAIRTALDGHSPGSFVALLGRKMALAWHWYELPNNDNFYHRRLRVPILQWLPITAWMIAPLALVGLVVGWRQRREAWPLYLLVATSLAPLLIFYVVGRFRIVLLAAAIPFAAVAIVRMVAYMRSRNWRPLAVMTTAVLALAAWTGRPLPPDTRLIRTSDWLLPYSARYQPRMQDAALRGNFHDAARSCERFFDEAPSPSELATSDVASDLPVVLSDIRMQCAGLWSRAGDQERAASQAALAKTLRDQHGSPISGSPR